MKNIHRSLIICLTPLQMLIAEKIVSLHPDKQFDLIVIALSDNEKYRNYYQRLSKSCKKSLYYKQAPGVFGFIRFIKALRLNRMHFEYRSIYLASIDSRYIQYIVSKNKKSSVYTFDDGTANIVLNSVYYNEVKINSLKKFIWRILGVNTYMSDIKKCSLLHYTIYKDLPNISNKTFFINLIDSEVVKVGLSSKPDNLRIYLGQPLQEVSDHFTPSRVSKILTDLRITHYFPHPREPYSNYKNSNISIIDTNLIIEDYIIQILENNPRVEVDIFSFSSTALLNISNIIRVKPKYIFDSYLYSRNKEFYNLASHKFNIPIVTTEKH